MKNINTLICTSNLGKLSEFRNFFEGKRNIFGLGDLNLIKTNEKFDPIENANLFLANAFVKIISAIYLLKKSEEARNLKINSIIVDDSGLCVPSLNFEPGVHSAYYAGSPKNDKNNREKLSQEILKSDKAFSYNDKEKRLKAYFVCFLMEYKIRDLANDFYNQEENFEAKDFESLSLINFEKEILSSIDLNLKGNSLKKTLCLRDFGNYFSENDFVNLYYGYCSGYVSNTEQNLILGAGHGYDAQFYPITNPEKSFASITTEEKNLLSHRGLALNAIEK